VRDVDGQGKNQLTLCFKELVIVLQFRIDKRNLYGREEKGFLESVKSDIQSKRALSLGGTFDTSYLYVLGQCSSAPCGPFFSGDPGLHKTLRTEWLTMH
jgi:hypothetical protein